MLRSGVEVDSAEHHPLVEERPGGWNSDDPLPGVQDGGLWRWIGEEAWLARVMDYRQNLLEGETLPYIKPTERRA